MDEFIQDKVKLLDVLNSLDNDSILVSKENFNYNCSRLSKNIGLPPVENLLQTSIQSEEINKETKNNETDDKNISNKGVPRKKPSAEPRPCEYCNKMFSRAWCLKTHLENSCSVKKPDHEPVQCSSCEKFFTNEVNLRKHWSYGKQFECKICNKKFCLTKVFTEHLMLHSGDVKYECQICLETFDLVKKLRSHERSHLSEVKKTFCMCVLSKTF